VVEVTARGRYSSLIYIWIRLACQRQQREEKLALEKRDIGIQYWVDHVSDRIYKRTDVLRYGIAPPCVGKAWILRFENVSRLAHAEKRLADWLWLPLLVDWLGL